MSNSAMSKAERAPVGRRWLRVGEWILLALLTAQISVGTAPDAWKKLNTDFPNYYLTARLVREHFDASRTYEWIWLQRQKDHRDIDQRIVGMVPITPFSTLAVYPLTALRPLASKHCWLVLNLGLLIATAYLLRALTQLAWRQIALIVALSFPLRVNFLYGQYYVLLLFLLTLSCWLYLRHRRFLAGMIIGLASGLKVFPILYLLYFLRKRDLRAFVGGVVGGLATAVTSVLAFGWELHRTYLSQVLPSALRGEGLDPYNLKAESLSSLLHRLFIYEPQLNVHPAVNAPWLFAVVHPLLQMAFIAPMLLFAIPDASSQPRVRLEWAALLLVSLAISTSASSYLFTLLILPACFIFELLQREKPYLAYAVLLPLYTAAGFLQGTNTGGEGWAALLAVPRLFAVVSLCLFTFAMVIRQESLESSKRHRPAWATALVVLVAFSIAANLRHQRGLYADYEWRVPTPKNVYMAVDPVVQGNATLFVAMTFDGYQSATQGPDGVQFSSPRADDHLAVAAANDENWVEQAGHESKIVSNVKGRSDILQAESPVASLDGRWLAFLREDHGRARIWLHALHPSDQGDKLDRPVTAPEFNVLEMTFNSEGGLIFAATTGGAPSLFTSDLAGNTRSLSIPSARYPAVSPDGRWLAYSALSGGNWNLWLRDLASGETTRITHASCNDIGPAWTPDSRSLVYASDCGRALWFTALCKRRIFP